MHTLRRFFKPVVCSLLFVLLATGFAVSAELDDSVLFVEAFDAYKQKDYLLAIEKIGQLNQVFPESPLRDVALLLQARASYRAGDNEVAAKAINRFTSEFAGNPLAASIEEELQSLAERQKKGEKLALNKPLRAAAQKVRAEKLAAERAAALKAEQERLAQEKAERERIAREKQEAERKERERLAAEKAAKESIRLAIAIPVSEAVETGKKGRLPFELINRGKNAEEFLITAPAASEYAAMPTSLEKPDEALAKITLAAGETFKGALAFTMPAGRVDGFKATLPLKVVSARFADVTFAKDAMATASAPLLRAVVKPNKTALAPGETFKYRLSVLNAGSMAARGLTVRAVLPEQVDFIDAAGSSYRQESAGVVTFRIDQLESGRLAEYYLNVKVREGKVEKQELRCQVEMISTELQLNQKSVSGPALIQAKK